MVRLVLMVATAAFTSFGTTSPPETSNSTTTADPRHADALDAESCSAYTPERFITTLSGTLRCRGLQALGASYKM